MRWFDTLRLRVRSLVRRHLVDAELEREVQFHLDQQIAEHLAAGMSPEQARLAARRTIGSLTQLREECRETRGLTVFDQLGRDVVLGWRTLRRSPTATTAIVVTLGLGIGATTAVYTAVDAALVRQLPFAAPHELVQVRNTVLQIDPGRLKAASDSGKPAPTPARLRPDLTDLGELRDVFARRAAYATGALNLATGPEPRRVVVTFVTDDFFGTLGRESALGRVFHAAEVQRNEARVVLSDRLWRAQFGADPAIVGKTIRLDERAYDVVGVMPGDFRFPAGTELWVPLPVPVPIETIMSAFRNFLPSVGVARLAPGVTPALAADRFDLFRARVRPPRPTDPPPLPSITPLQRSLVGDRRTALLVLMASAALVLLIACANAATLLLARAAARRGELTTHAALGATRGRLFRRLLVESVMLAGAGAGLGVAITLVSHTALSVVLPPALADLAPVRLDWRVLTFALLVALSTVMLFGLWPALATSRVRVGELLGGVRGVVVTTSTRTNRVLVVTQVALACVLVVGAGLMLLSLRALLGAGTGMDVERVVTARLNLPSNTYSGREVSGAFVESVVERLSAAPGVEAAAAINTLPFGQELGVMFRVDARATVTLPVDDRPFAPYLVVSPDYFRVMGIPLVRGRTLTWADGAHAPVVVINRTLARQLGGEDAVLGTEITYAGRRTVVGVVEDARFVDLATPVGPQVYQPIQEQPQSYLSIVARGRSSDDADRVLAQIRDAVRALDPSLPIYATQPLDVVLGQTVATRRVNTLLIASFGVLAVALAAIGIYGVLAYSVGQRTREIGIRMALGARRTAVVRLVVGQGMLLACLGVAIGLAGALAVTRYMEGMLHGVRPRDPLTFGVVGFGFLALALVASCLPARQAATVDPITTLRAE